MGSVVLPDPRLGHPTLGTCRLLARHAATPLLGRGVRTNDTLGRHRRTRRVQPVRVAGAHRPTTRRSRLASRPGATRRRVNGGSRASYGQPMRPGDRIRRRVRLSSWRTKPGTTGSLLFVDFEHEWRNERDDFVREAVYVNRPDLGNRVHQLYQQRAHLQPELPADATGLRLQYAQFALGIPQHAQSAQPGPDRPDHI